VRTTFYRILALIAATVLLVIALPRESKVAYEYKVGTPWKYAPLIAPFNFPVSKSDEEIKVEWDSASRAFQPFFNYDASVGDTQIARFRSDFMSGKFNDASPRILSHIVKGLQRVYAAGVLSPEDMMDLLNHGTQSIRQIEGQEAKSVSLAGLFSTKTAYEDIMNADSAHFDRSALAAYNLSDYIVQNYTLDEEKTNVARQDMEKNITAGKGLVQTGQRIIDRGEIVTAEQEAILDSFVRESNAHHVSAAEEWRQAGGQALFIFLVLTLLLIYLLIYRPQYLGKMNTGLLLLVLVLIFPILAYLNVRHGVVSVFVIPFAMVPLFVQIFYDSFTAVITMLVSLLLASLGIQGPYEFLLLEIFMGLMVIYEIKDLSERAQLFRVALHAFVAVALLQFAYDTAQGTAFLEINPARYTYLAIACVLLLFAYPLMYVVEKMFGLTSNVTLIELSNTNRPLLQKLAKVARGTFSHSMQVATLAAEVAEKIGGQAQLVRTGALYHDIGKMENPAFFTENQTGVNPHDELQARDGLSAEELSAKIIISHVTDGLALADKYHLPRVVRDFIATHHGRSHTGFFYIKWQNNHPGQTPPEDAFTYPGPNPSTKEQAILMMCDAVEASSRSLKEYTEENISGLVNRIIDGQMKEGFFDECPITFKDISDAKKVLIESLKTVYHTRISYPELNKTDKPASVQPRFTRILGDRFGR